MRMPFGFWKSGGPVFDPGTLLPDGWWGAPFGPAVPWLPKPGGAWTANGNLDSTAGNQPAVGPPVKGALTPARNNGSKFLATDNGYATFIATNALTVVTFFQNIAPGANAANATGDHGNIVDVGNSNVCMASSLAGVRACVNGFQNTNFIPLAANTWAMAVLRFAGNVGAGTGLLSCLVSQPSGTVLETFPTLASFGYVGKLYPGGRVLGLALVGDLAEALAWRRVLSTPECLSLLDYFNPVYGKGLT